MKVDGKIYKPKSWYNHTKKEVKDYQERKMLSKGELKILKGFRKDFFKNYTFSEIKENLKESSNNKVQLALKHFEEDKLIDIQRNKGFNLINLSLNSPQLPIYFNLLDLECFGRKEWEILGQIKELIVKKNLFCSLVVFGSYAKGNSLKNSDLDIAIIFKNEQTRKELKSGINSIKRRSLIEIDEHYFLVDEFIEMLKSDKENLGKEISRNFLVFYGGEFFYNLIFENGKIK